MLQVNLQSNIGLQLAAGRTQWKVHWLVVKDKAVPELRTTLEAGKRPLGEATHSKQVRNWSSAHCEQEHK